MARPRIAGYRSYLAAAGFLVLAAAEFYISSPDRGVQSLLAGCAIAALRAAIRKPEPLVVDPAYLAEFCRRLGYVRAPDDPVILPTTGFAEPTARNLNANLDRGVASSGPTVGEALRIAEERAASAARRPDPGLVGFLEVLKETRPGESTIGPESCCGQVTREMMIRARQLGRTGLATPGPRRASPWRAWGSVEILAAVGTSFGVLADAEGVLTVVTRAPGAAWPDGIDEGTLTGRNTIAEGATRWVVTAVHDPS